MAEKKSPTIEFEDSNESNQYNKNKMNDFTSDTQKALMQNAEIFLENFGPVNDFTDATQEERIKSLETFYEDMNKAEKRALSDEEEENISRDKKRRQIDCYNIEDEPFQFVGGTKNKKNLSHNEYDSLTPLKNSSMAQDPFTPKHVATCSSTEEPSTSNTLSAQLPPPPSIPSSSQPSFNPKLVQTCSDAEEPSASSSSSTQPPQPPVSASTSRGTRSVSSLR